ncbi:uncharacterized protein LOC121180472 isoform X2 [Toxotes jaculatrix]|uniref:uncharacterized protein LOC121180472 isoform X2 n=1 Tax=Toxotes jaculatrix TaxID=941984 RepID=UPI001B3A951D|nr:uncharacterized protein LOC121180472 isoform X2 [Toxotes jaculatrix]
MGKTEDCEGMDDKPSVATGLCVKKHKKPLSEEARRVKRENDRQRGRTRVNLGPAYSPWKKLREKNGFKTDAEMAIFLINIYLRTKSESRPERPSLERSSSTETCYERGATKGKPFQVRAPAVSVTGVFDGTDRDEHLNVIAEATEIQGLEQSESVHYEYPFMMSSPNEVERETCAAVSVQSSENGKEPEKKEWTTNRLSENKENRDIQEDEDEEFSTSLSVGDGRYLVDLGSSSEFIVDEECILQLFRSCRECNRQCTVRKHVRGLKLVVNQACCFCQSRCKWTNLPDDDDDDDDDKDDSDFHINGKDTTHGQTNTAMSPSSNTS